MYNAAKVRLINSEIQSVDALMSRDTLTCGTTGHASHTGAVLSPHLATALVGGERKPLRGG